MNNRIIKVLSQPWRIVCSDRLKPFTNIVPDKLYIRCLFRKTIGYWPNLSNPKSYNEKLQWLKLYNRRPEYTMMSDKYLVKQFVKEKIGEKYVIPTYGIWDTPEEIDFESLPDQFVLKCTHNSSVGLCICEDKALINREKVRKDLEAGLRENFFWGGREWPYKGIKPRIIAEQFLNDRKTGELRDYKLFCFNGKFRALFIATNRQNPNEETNFDFFDEKLNHLPILSGHPMASITPAIPDKIDEMINIAEKLSAGIPHVRVDLYEVDDAVYFGEMTFFHWSGFVPMTPIEWDKTFGDWLQLPIKKPKKTD